MPPIKALLHILFVLALATSLKAERPNILWIVIEDMSAHFGYNGETQVQTPNVDRLAEAGVVFDRAYVSAPVCSTARSALITGMHQNTIGAHNHRSSEGIIEIHLPENVRTVPEYFRDAGYFTANQRLRGLDRWGEVGKEDYNFVYERADLYDAADWLDRPEGQPFFAQIQLGGGKSRGANPPNRVDPDTVVLPPHYPNDPVLREDWARYLNSVQLVDQQLGSILDRLESEGQLENTVIFFLTDHGISHARGKQFCYEEGAHIPLIVWSKGLEDGGVRSELVSHIDVAASSLYLAGIEIPEHMQARTLFGDEAEPRQYVITARDRCDETVDRIRSVRMGDYLYIRNYLPLRPMLQPNAYKDRKEWMVRLRELHQAGQLNELQERLLFADQRPDEELYNLALDQHQYTNLAEEPNMRTTLESMRAILREWEIRANDQGRTLEPHAVVEKENQLFIESLMDRGQPERVQTMRQNLELMKRWANAGK